MRTRHNWPMAASQVMFPKQSTVRRIAYAFTHKEVFGGLRTHTARHKAIAIPIIEYFLLGSEFLSHSEKVSGHGNGEIAYSLQGKIYYSIIRLLSHHPATLLHRRKGRLQVHTE